MFYQKSKKFENSNIKHTSKTEASTIIIKQFPAFFAFCFIFNLKLYSKSCLEKINLKKLYENFIASTANLLYPIEDIIIPGSNINM